MGDKEPVKAATATKEAVEKQIREERATPSTGEQKSVPREAQSNRGEAKPQTPEETRIHQMKEKDKGPRN